MQNWRTEWAKGKIDTALELNSGKCGGSYGESAMILCAALSAFAAEVWPGNRIDRVRFVELLRKFAPDASTTTKISVPLLVGHLRNNGRVGESEEIKRAFLGNNFSRVFVGSEVDVYESEIINTCGALSLKEIREHSYANLLYVEVRSPYAHEYAPGGRADSWPMTGKKDEAISYVNWATEADRRIHFHIEWLSELVKAIASKLDSDPKIIGIQKPAKWWV